MTSTSTEEDTSTATRDCGCTAIRTYECHGFDSDKVITTTHLCEEHQKKVASIDGELEDLSKRRRALQEAKSKIKNLFVELEH